MKHRDDEWVSKHTARGPETLVDRICRYLDAAPGDSLAERIASAAASARDAAEVDGSSRNAAADLLAADSLVTLALLEAAERDPGGLNATARHLLVEAVIR